MFLVLKYSMDIGLFLNRFEMWLEYELNLISLSAKAKIGKILNKLETKNIVSKLKQVLLR